LKDSFLNFEYNCEKISLEAITVQKKKGGQGLIETQYRSLNQKFIFESKVNFDSKVNFESIVNFESKVNF
jgi:hypothetical protein